MTGSAKVNKDYGMFSQAGNLLVDRVVEEARVQGWSWAKTYRHLVLLARAHPNTASECLDTAVREAVYDALEFTESFYGA
jgi:hypothetical protein